MQVAKFLLSIGYKNVTEAHEKIVFYKKCLGCSFTEVVDMIKIQPRILDLSKEKISLQIAMIKEMFSMQDKQVFESIRKYPNLLGITKKMAEQKKTDLKVLFSLDDENAELFVRKMPEILIIKESAVIQRIQFLKEKFSFTNAQIKQMIINKPVILRREVFNEISRMDNLTYLRQIANKEDIIKNAMLLTFPAKKIKVRFLILAPILGKDVVLEGNELKRNERLLWARKEFLRERNLDEKKIIEKKKLFQELSSLTDNQLIKKYPFTYESLGILEREYFQKFGEKLELDREERNAMFSPQVNQKERRNARILDEIENE